jgi:uroporphyrin-III C-methyltransferase
MNVETGETPKAPQNTWQSIVALVALGVAVAVAGYVWVEQRSGLGQRVSEIRDQVGTSSSELAALSARLDDVTAGRQRLNDDLDGLTERVARETEALGVLPTRVDELQRTVERFVGAGDKVRESWLLAEAEHYMRIANAQLGLAGDVDVAQTALGLADDTLRELSDPRLIPVRKLLAEEIGELKGVPRPDTEGIVLSLGSLSDSLDTLPLKGAAPEAFRAKPEAPAAPLTGFARALAASRAALRSLVTVRRVDDPISPLLTEAEQSVVIRSLDLELQLARLAIMRGDAGLFRRSIDAARERVEEHFDLTSPDVQAVLESLSELSVVKLPEQLPDISGSLVTLLKVTGSTSQ